MYDRSIDRLIKSTPLKLTLIRLLTHFPRPMAVLVWWSLQAHPAAMACAYECVKYTMDNDFIGNAKRLEPVMVEGRSPRLLPNPLAPITAQSYSHTPHPSNDCVPFLAVPTPNPNHPKP